MYLIWQENLITDFHYKKGIISVDLACAYSNEIMMNLLVRVNDNNSKEIYPHKSVCTKYVQNKKQL